MNKLVSKNPVLRFKLGRKIVKAKDSWGSNFGVYTFTPTNELNIRERTNKAAKEVIKNTKEITPAELGRYNRTHSVGNFSAENDIGVVSPNYFYRSDRNDILGKSFEDDFPYIYNDDGTLNKYSILVLLDAQKRKAYSDIVNQMPKIAVKNIINSSNNVSNNTGSSVINTTGTKDTTSNNLVTLKNSGRTSGRTSGKTSRKSTILPSPKFYGLTIGGKVLARGSNFNGLINDSLKQALLNAGFKNEDFNDVRSFLNALNNFFLKDKAGSIKVDDMWGDQTLKAFDLALSKAGYDPSNKKALTPTTISNIYGQNRLSGLQAARLMNKPELPTIPERGISNFTPLSTAKTYNRADVRDFIRSKGRGAYDFSGSLRKALRMVLNGQGTDEDKAIVKAMGLFKQGGQLISRNPIKRFKQKNFRLVVQ